MSRQKRAKKMGPAGGLGVRYGVKPRRRFSVILTEMKRKHVCPQCTPIPLNGKASEYGSAVNAG